MSEPLNVLMVEDSETDAMLVIHELRRGGFNPIWQRVQTAQELHTALNSSTWDAIISDYRLPGFNAFMALEIAKQSQKDIPFILVSGTIGEVSAVEMMKAGAHDYVMKDNLNRLPVAVRRELRDAQVRAERKQAQNLLQTLASNIPGMIYSFVYHLNGSFDFEYISLGCLDLLELTPDEVLENASLCFAQIHIDDRAGFGVAAKQSAQTLSPFFYEWRLATPSGKLKWVQASARSECRENGDIVWHGVLLDVSDRKQAQELIIHNALHDPLTDLPNRTLLVERLELAINRAKRVDTYLYAVLFLDLDRFKVINDSLGHLAGDQLLKTIAQKLKTHLREVDLVARIGGDEFVILLEDISGIEKAIQITERIMTDFQTALILNDSEVVISTSIGIVLGTKDYSHASDLLRDADIAMYKAKAQDRNSYKIFDIEMHTQAVNRLTLETDIRKALEREEFVIYYQPIVDILGDAYGGQSQRVSRESGRESQMQAVRLIGFEALVRWQHPTRGFILPGEFIPIAEETGLIVQIDRWMFYTACQQLANWKSKFTNDLPLKISINLSAQDIRQARLLEDIDQTLAKTGLEGDFLAIEITESMLIENISKTIDLLTQLKARKIQITIDDFGSGYSSLNYLHRLPADNLKIDRSFVNQMQEGNRNYQVVSTIIALSNQLGLVVIAEGIETSQQLQWLQQLGCKFGQGYLFSEPLSHETAEALVASKTVYLSSDEYGEQMS
ncbi:MAG: putative bifunctional diguanylate cyclase/phosphodiesterase [Nostoc sp. ChiQUE02]|uniref:putative bifunctional diguanylate cyclase/phosphodiesterase n=1 Tax=Nostoc sp. ChiQUE02 TaxID=3075377 RepID=UPI002AD38544|nr:EAL domain-containing protein [Nostoc sp. ChiQUE02]MDZ8234599.1 EAL domain-containing protein [Nostoc sp. ChiQUE02]